LKIRGRSKNELRTRLERKNFSAAVIDAVLDFLVKLGYVNDSKFAQDWINSRMNSAPRSRRFLRYELSQKGVAAELIESALELIDEEAEYNTAKQLAEKRFSRLKGLPRAVIKRRLNGYLVRRGYSRALCLRIIKEIMEDEG